MSWTWIPIGLAAVAGYEIVRWRIVKRVGAWLQDGALGFVRANRVRLESARFLDRVWLREALLMDPAVEHAASEAARERGVPLRGLLLHVERWATEMAPAFSLSAYYRLGGGLSKLAVNLAYDLLFDRGSYERAMAAVPKGSICVFVINHRSNADYIVLSYALLRRVALSYAVGEWARVWPLDLLFRSFGSFFIRRGEGDRLYHKVLERFVQLLVGHGGTTGFFIEGGLSRDGALRPPKAGLLDYIVGIRREQPDREITFVPVGLNFDRVLEDADLVREAEHTAPPGLGARMLSLGRVVLGLPWLLLVNLARLIVGRRPGAWATRKLGYAAVTVGTPLTLTSIPGGARVADLDDEIRRPEIKRVASLILSQIAATIPVTPVPVLALALLETDDRGRGAIIANVRDLLIRLRAAGAPIALGEEQARPTSASGIDGFDDSFDATEEAERAVRHAAALLRRRGLLRLHEGRFELSASALPILKYYARSIGHYVDWNG